MDICRTFAIRLPPLTGRVGTIALAVYRVLALLAALYAITDLPLEGVDLFRNSPAVSQYGFAVQRGAQGKLPVTALYPSAVRAGLNIGDRIIGLDSARLSSAATRFDLGARLAALKSAPAKLMLLNRSGVARQLVLSPQARGLTLTHLFYSMPIWAFGIVQLLSLALPLLILLGASFLLYKRRPHDSEAMLLAFSFLALCFSTSGGSWPFLYAHIPDIVSDVTAQLGTALLCVAIAGVPDGKFSSIWAKLAIVFAVVYGLAGTQLMSLKTDNAILGIVSRLPEYAALACAMLALLARYRISAEMVRQQIKWVAIGTIVTILAAAVPLALAFSGVDAAMGLVLGHVIRLSVFVVFHVALPIGLVISVLAYRLYDSETVVTQSAAYAILSVAVIAVFAASESVVQSFGHTMVSGQLGTFPGALATVFTAMMITPMQARIKRVVERGFRKDLYSMREGLPPLVGDLRETTDLKHISSIVIDRVWSGVRPTQAAIIMGETPIATREIDDAGVIAWLDRWAPLAVKLERNKADPVFPTRIPLAAEGLGRIGWLLLGARPDGSLYARDERKALNEIAEPIARALAVAAAREARSALREDSNKALQVRLDQVEAALAKLAAQKLA